MARFFHALVVMGGGVVGCGRGVGNVEQTRAGDGATTGTPSSPGDSGGASMGSTMSGGAVTSQGTPTTGGATSTTAAGGAAAQGTAGATDASVPAGTSVVDSEPPPEGVAARGPDACPSQQWDCSDLLLCRYEDTPACGMDHDGTVASCPAVPVSPCECDAARPAADVDCAAGEVFVCLEGAFSAAGDAGTWELLRFDCRCVLPQARCDEYCDAHGVGGYGRACEDTGSVLLCGGCVYTGILR